MASAFLSGSHYGKWTFSTLEQDGGLVQHTLPLTGKETPKPPNGAGTEHPGALRTLSLHTGHFTRGTESLPIGDDPNHTGGFLDYEAGIFSFYNVSDGMAHLNTFRCRFMELVYSDLRLWEGSAVRSVQASNPYIATCT